MNYETLWAARVYDLRKRHDLIPQGEGQVEIFSLGLDRKISD